MRLKVGFDLISTLIINNFTPRLVPLWLVSSTKLGLHPFASSVSMVWLSRVHGMETAMGRRQYILKHNSSLDGELRAASSDSQVLTSESYCLGVGRVILAVGRLAASTSARTSPPSPSCWSWSFGCGLRKSAAVSSHRFSALSSVWCAESTKCVNNWMNG